MEQTGFDWLRIGSSGRLSFDKLNDYQIFKEYPAPVSEFSLEVLQLYTEA
jgi:hypothetical protein